MTGPSTPPQFKMPGKRRKAQILGAATELFAKQGYEGTSLRDVAELCGMTKAALYYHYTDKEALLRSVVEFRMARMIDMMEAALAKVPEDQPIERIRTFVQTSAKHIDTDRAGWVVGSRIFWSIEALTDRSAVVDLRDRYEGMLRAEIAKGIEAGFLVDRDAGMMSRMILSWLNYIPRWHRLDGRLTSQQIADEFLDMTLNGMRTP